MREKAESSPIPLTIMNEKQTIKKMSLRFRASQLMDVPPLAALIEDHRDTLLDDYTQYSRPYLISLLSDPSITIIEQDGYAVGAFWVTNTYENLHAQLHFLLNPRYLRQALRENVLIVVINNGFKNLSMGKLKAQAYQTQSSAMSLLKKFGFQQVGLLHNEARIQGKAVDLYLFELSFSEWVQWQDQHHKN